MNVQRELYRPWLVLVVPLLSRSSESSKHILLSVWLHLRKPEKIQRHFTHLFVLHIKNAQFVSSERRYVRVWGTATRFVHGILEMLPIKQTQTNLNGFVRPRWLTQPLSTAAQQESKFLQISLTTGWPIFKRNIKKDVHLSLYITPTLTAMSVFLRTWEADPWIRHLRGIRFKLTSLASSATAKKKTKRRKMSRCFVYLELMGASFHALWWRSSSVIRAPSLKNFRA